MDDFRSPVEIRFRLSVCIIADRGEEEKLRNLSMNLK